ncbi:hypothetical protein niasHS_009877 [Heterodera schachtii]|uniref:Uncharacterized protein n=1 Tax=Heterodera schachtii TaxID=97005 RepID=A0ABD2JCS9_HETSC
MSKPILKNVHTNKKPTQKQKHGAPNFAPIHPICEKPEKVKIFADECQRKCVDIKSPTPKSKEWAKRAFHCEKVLCTENGIKCDANKRLIMKYDETLFASRQQNDELNARNDDEKAEMRMQLQKISSQNEQLHLQNNAKDEIIQKISAENEQLHLKVNEFGQTAGGGGEKNNQKFECVIDQQNVKVKIELDIKGANVSEALDKFNNSSNN